MFLRGLTTIETLLMTVLMSAVMISALGVKQFALEQFRQQIHRDRAVLAATETMEQLEALRLTRERQNLTRSWDRFLGGLDDGSYQFFEGEQLAQLELLPLDEEGWQDCSTDEDEPGVIVSLLRRRILLETLSEEMKRVTVEVAWGKDLVRFQKLFSPAI